MKEFLKKALFFLRLTDEDNLLSITHIACWVVITKIALTPEPNIAEMGGLLVSLALYYGKKHINHKKVKLTQEQTDVISKMQETINGLKDKVGAVATTIGLTKRQ